ncbi:MAG: hypothetical protein P1P89_05340 [Desulfobacterales bacterium]|nr:hypothetical protein [Desulfobacterales bacterium]
MEQDKWGRDPAVQQMRRIFTGMEQIQKTLLDQVRISPFDGRLRSVRETALNLFDKAVARAAGKGIRLTDTAMKDIFTGCLHQAMRTSGMAISQDLLPDDRNVRELLREVSR